MFVLVAFAYPCVLAALCVGAGLLVDRAAGGWLPAMLLAAVGVAGLIAVSQIATYFASLAPATPWLMLGVGVAGIGLGRARLRAFVLGWRSHGWQILVLPLAYVIALAPVLMAGRPTFSAYMALSDSAFHLLGADYLVRHGQDYAHLDLSNSYGAFINNYYNTGYPSGADTLFGGSGALLGLPLIWAFQPFNAFLLAAVTGPAWVLARRMGLDRGWAALAVLATSASALVYAYELIGSIKEITALSLVLAIGALVIDHRRWLSVGPRGAIPLALLVAGGLSALSVAFGAWALAAVVVLTAVVLSDRRERWLRLSGGLGGRLARLVGVGALVVLVGAWPTFANLGGSVHVAQAIASTSNPGNLHTPLRADQVLGIWLGRSYKLLPTGTALTVTYVLMGVTLLAVLLGLARLLRARKLVFASWFAAMLIVWQVLYSYGTTWSAAKTLVLTSPAVVLLAWAGVAAVRNSRVRLAAPVLAAVLAGGALTSDAMQYHSTNLAPTERYEELASIDQRFAGRGPVLFTDFDEYSLYELRDMDVGGPDFTYPPPALAAAAGGYGKPVQINHVKPTALLAYPLIVTRRDPSTAPPPAPYRLVWQGAYYQVWRRPPVSARHDPPARRRQAAPLIPIPLARTIHPSDWVLTPRHLMMSSAGTLTAKFLLPHDGAWELWMKGDVMRALTVRVDGRSIGTLAEQIGGNSLVVNVLTPLRAYLRRGHHTLSITRAGANLAPGDGGAATLSAIFFAPSVASMPASLSAISKGSHVRRRVADIEGQMVALRLTQALRRSGSEAVVDGRLPVIDFRAAWIGQGRLNR